MKKEIDFEYLGTLQHAYHYADDLQPLLEDIRSENREVRNKAYCELCGSIIHQGSVYESTVYLFPFFIDMFLNNVMPNQEAQDDLFTLIASIAAGDAVFYTYPEFAAHTKRVPGESDDELQQRKEQEITSSIRAEGSKIVSLLLPYLEHKESGIRECIALMIPCYPEYFDTSIPLLENAFQNEEDEDAKEIMQDVLEQIGR